MVMEKSTPLQGFASLNKSSMIPQKSSKTLAFDYEALAEKAEKQAEKSAVHQQVVQNVLSRYD